VNIILHIEDEQGGKSMIKEVASNYLLPIIGRKKRDVYPCILILIEKSTKLLEMEIFCDAGKFWQIVPCGEKLPDFEAISFQYGWVPVAETPSGMRAFSYEKGEWLPHMAE
jgi:hypothetical protein